MSWRLTFQEGSTGEERRVSFGFSGYAVVSIPAPARPLVYVKCNV